MMRSPAFLLFCFLISVDCGHKASLPWVDSYAEAVRLAVKNTALSQSKARLLRELFSSGMEFWIGDKVYQAVRLEVGKVQRVNRQLRLEVGSPAWGGYRVAWFLETSKGVIVFSNLTSDRSILKSFELSKPVWKRLIGKVAESSRDFASCSSNLGIEDGSIYMGSYAEEAARGSFALYGWVPAPGDVDISSFSPKMEPCRSLVMEVFEITKSGSDI